MGGVTTVVYACLPFWPVPGRDTHTPPFGKKRQVVQTLNPWAAVLPSNYSRVALPEFLGVNEGKMGACGLMDGMDGWSG